MGRRLPLLRLLLVVGLATLASVGLGAARAQDAPTRIKVSAADKRAITELSKRFLMSAVIRRNLDSSYDLVTTKMKGGRTRAEWRKGDLPVVPVPARGSLAAVWIYRQTSATKVYLVFILTPPSGVGGYYLPFDLEATKVGGRWLVNFWTLHLGWPPVPAGGKIRIPFLETHDLGGKWIPPELRTLPPDLDTGWDDSGS
jgi:hypothetical protein